MTERFIDFDAVESDKDEEKQAPPSFKLGGEMFTCLPSPKATAVASLTRAGDGNIDALISYLRELVEEDQRETFEKVLDDNKNVVDLDKLAKIVNWVSEVYAGRPTK